MSRGRLLFFMMLSSLMTTSGAGEDSPAASRRVDFNRDVRPLLVKHCLACHGPTKQKGGLRLDQKAAALLGGDGGPVIVAGNGGESLIVQLTAGQEEDRIMPPKGQRLTAEEVGTLKAWIDQGAEWPVTVPADDARGWWSLRPLVRPAVPGIPQKGIQGAGIRNPIDAFVRAKLAEKGLEPSPEADRRTLGRRLYFDLVGLPPTPEVLDQFVNDPRPDAFERLVDRLLDDPRHGERWARHWLDVVHYGDTHGYDKDQPRPNAWPYRDYVIRSFNADKPYGRFVREQIAGDVLEPGSPEGVTALGFIAAGPWDLIGQAEVPETKIDGKVARHLDRDDMVSNTVNTFLGLTVQCAQCHNHKFDPIRQEDYYRLQAVFAALDRADRPYFNEPEVARKSAELKSRRDDLRRRRAELESPARKACGPELDELDRRIAAASQPASTRPEFGYHSGLDSRQDATRWVQVDLGRSLPLGRVILWGCHDDFNNIGAGFGFPVRFRIEAGNDPSFRTGSTLIADRTGFDMPNPGVVSQAFLARGVKARYVRVTATKLAPRLNDFMFALAELEVLDSAGTNLTGNAAVTALDSIEAPPRWRKTNLVDGHAPGQRHAAELAELTRKRQALVAEHSDSRSIAELAKTAAELGRVESELTRIKPTGLVYAGTIQSGTGAFRGTGPDGGKPRPIQVLRRGDVRSAGPEVGPGALDVLAELPGSFELSAGHTEGDRRAALAYWLTDSRNSLLWRAIVNRVWQYHFGRGIVATANDFGRMGQLPTHPVLLDWLAVELRDGGQSLKSLHRLIVTSGTYRQVSNPTGRLADAARAVDAGNALLWRMNSRKLEAEAVRDAALAVAGRLDPAMYGPCFRDFVVEHPEHSPHYEYQLNPPDDPKTFRRAVYRFLVRSKPQPFMTVLDCADPSMQVDRRNESVSPLQALAMYNNGFMLVMARHLARRVESAGGLAEQTSRALRLALGRDATAAERTALAEYARAHGLANACRLILNLNEFVFVD
jgi:mono/diheme cytochrome c family protein